MKWASWTNVVFAVWLILAPWILGYHMIVPTFEDLLLGVSVLIIALWSANTIQDTTGYAWTNAALGIWIAIAPWGLGYRNLSQALANDVIVGILVAALAVSRATNRTASAGVHPPMRHA
jgi:SPW repeat-containing protein